MSCAGDVVIMGRRLQDFEEVLKSLLKKQIRWDWKQMKKKDKI
jgi:hypothetical protein